MQRQEGWGLNSVEQEAPVRGRPPGTGCSAHERQSVWSEPRNPAGSPSGREHEKDDRGPSAGPGVAGPCPGLPARAGEGGRGGRTGRAAARRLLTPAAVAWLGQRPAQAGKPRGEPSPPPPLRGACRAGGKTKNSDSPCPPRGGGGAGARLVSCRGSAWPRGNVEIAVKTAQQGYPD
ncbi:hypothetical protein NDU88_001765 [Pleurodeles waltl]|uniref:Uncharacterized protein n=1 Tax=Pleurodeles waltl TaxID=8319 RepID=A0AAV7KQC7_PLEWA|nr:hypothetical protein NDU88_001765 [Pleurodeles waltl]